MPNITCPRCGISVFAEVRGNTIELKSRGDLTPCPVLSSDGESQLLDDRLECPEMESIVEAAIAGMGRTPAVVIWPRDHGEHRELDRWTPINGVLTSDDRDYPCAVLDISPGGAKVWTDRSGLMLVGTEVTFRPFGYDPLYARVSRTQNDLLGLTFQIDDEKQRLFTEWLIGVRQAVFRVHDRAR